MKYLYDLETGLYSGVVVDGEQVDLEYVSITTIPPNHDEKTQLAYFRNGTWVIKNKPVPKMEYKPKHILLDYGEFVKLNYEISKLKGWKEGSHTARSRGMNPPLAKVNIQYHEDDDSISYDLKFVFTASSKEQEQFPDLFAKYELVDSYVPADDELDTLIATDLNQEIIDWVLRHYTQVGMKKEGLTIWLENDPPSSLGEEVIDELVNKGITVIVVDNEN